MHEQIENEYIIGLLQQRCCTVHNVHSDNKLSEMLTLFEKGLHNVKVVCVDLCLFYTLKVGFFCLHALRGHLVKHLLLVRVNT